MTVVLPDPARLADVETLLAERDWSAVLDAPSHERLELRLPRFTVPCRAPGSGELLAALGMPTAFTDEADFSGLTADELSEDQRGPARGLRRRRRAGHRGGGCDRGGHAAGRRDAQPPVPFVVDRPFLFAIHTTSDADSAVRRAS